MAPAKDQLLAANCAACAGWYVEEAGGQVHTTIAIYSWRTRATPAARAMAEESQHEMPEGTLIESPSRHDAEPREEPVLLGGPEAGSPWCRNPWTPREPAAASASVPVKAEVSIKTEEQEQEEVSPAARAPRHEAVAQEQEQTERHPTAQAQSHGAVAQKQPTGATLPHAATPPTRVTVLVGAQSVQREARSTGDSSADQAQSHELGRKKPRSTDDLFAQPPPNKKPAILAQQALKSSRGIARVKLEELGPATFNRGGTVTDSQHCHNLMRRILTEEAFATYRYEAGYCHEPNPKDPFVVATHGNRMVAKAPHLPQLPEAALKGTFAKTHLVTALQMYKAGRMPELARVVEARSHEDPEELEEFRTVLEHGLYMHVFPWAEVERNPAGFKALMASDNFQQGVGLKDSEVRCVHAMRRAMDHLDAGAEPLSTEKLRDLVIQHTKTYVGTRWMELELDHFWQFAVTTEELPLELLHNVWVHGQFESRISVDAAWLKHLSELAVTQQWVRTALCVLHFMSNTQNPKEYSMVGGRLFAAAVGKRYLQLMKPRNATAHFKAQSHVCEEFLVAMMERYYTPWADTLANPPFDRLAWMSSVVSLLCKVAKLLLKMSCPTQGQASKLATQMCTEWETSCRKHLAKHAHGSMPEAANFQALPEAPSHGPSAAPVNDDTPPAELKPVERDAKGSMVVSLKRRAEEAGFLAGVKVLRRDADESLLVADDVGEIKHVARDAILVSWAGADASFMDLEDLVHPTKKIKLVVDPREKALETPGVKWSPCASSETSNACKAIAMHMAYSLYVTQSELDLHITEVGPLLEIRVRRSYEPNTLVLLPFGPSISDAESARQSSLPVQLVITPKGEADSVLDYRLKARPPPKVLRFGSENAPVVVPFWVLVTTVAEGAEPRASDGTRAVPLAYRTAKVTVPVQQCLAKGLKGAASKESIVYRTLYATNPTRLTKGDVVVLSEHPPSTLDSEE